MPWIFGGVDIIFDKFLNFAGEAEMYYYLNGILAELWHDKAVIECGGVGYLASITGKTYEELSKKNPFDASGNMSGVRVKLFTHHVLREDASELYGFSTKDECEIFKLLISVSGLGPKGAMAILSTLSVQRLVTAVASGDAKAISASPGIGTKTAQKIIIELKDKLAKGFDLELSEEDGFSENFSSGGDTSEAVDALIVLGYSKNEAQKAVSRCKSTSVEDIIREALKLLMK